MKLLFEILQLIAVVIISILIALILAMPIYFGVHTQFMYVVSLLIVLNQYKSADK